MDNIMSASGGINNIPATIIVSINDKVLFCSQYLEYPLTDTFYIFGKNYYLSSKNYGANSRQGKHAVIYDPNSVDDNKSYRIRIWFSYKEINLSIGSNIQDNIEEANLVYDHTHKFNIYDTIHIKSIDKKISISTRKLTLFNNEVELDAILIINTD